METALGNYLLKLGCFAVIWDGHFGSSLHLFKMNEVAKNKGAKVGGVYGAIYEQFYDLTKGLIHDVTINGEYDWRETEWLDALQTVMEREAKHD